MKNLLLIFFALSVFVMNNALAQGKKTTGKVVSADDGQPLPGVSVKIQGTQQGVLTDGDGNFTVPASIGETLVFTYIGFTPQTVKITAGTLPQIRLKGNLQELVEVVVKDTYGSQATKSYTGSAASVKGSDNENKPYSSFQQALQGEVAGVSVNISTGQPGANPQVRIRGVNSITSTSAAQPLYVIDGMFVTTGQISQYASNSSALSGLNDDDIETITVLKDAAATAIYGSRGENGVIVITTKRGRAGKTQIRFDTEYGTTSNLPLPAAGKPLNGDQYRSLFNEAFANDNYTPAQIATLDGTYGLNGPSNNWYDLVTNNGAQRQYNLSLNGGDEKTKIFTSVGYYDQESTMLNSTLRRITGLLNIDHTISKSFSISTGLNFSNIQQHTPLTGSSYYANPVTDALWLRPFQLAYNPDGSINSSTTGNTNFPSGGPYNPIYIAANDNRLLSETRILGSQTIRWNIWDQLKYTGFVSIDYHSIEETIFQNPAMGDGISSGGIGTSDYTRYFNWLTRNQLDYRYNIPKIEDFYVDASIGYEAQRTTEYLSSAVATGYPATQPLLTSVAAAATPTKASESFSNVTYAAFYAKAGLNYKNLYSLTGSIRNEGSSRFGPSHQYGTFYSVGGAWNIDQESFFKQQTTFTTLKLRSSYGTNGNAEALGNYQWRPTAGYGNNYNSSTGQNYNTIGNPNLTWESSKKFDVGTDVGFFNDRLLFTVDYYNNKVDGLIQSVILPYETGFGSQAQNIGALQNKGLEFTVKGVPVKTQDFTWNVNFNIATNANKMTKLSTADAQNGSYWLGKGWDYYTYYAPLYAGVDPANGNALWYTNGTKTATTTNYANAKRSQIGQADPKITSGFSNTFRYKGLSLTFDFYGSFGNRVSDSWSYYMSDGAYITQANKYSDELNRWTTPGQITQVPKLVYGGGSSSSSSSYSSRFLYYGDFIRLKNSTLGYDFKDINFLKTLGISKLYLYGRATNLYTKTYDKRLPFDPEVPITGFYNEDIPQVRTFTMGLNVGF
jgi:TonB-linked SusC/RagA family outer membrane protein